MALGTRGGRPPKPEGEKYQQIQVSLTLAQIEALKALSNDLGRPMSMVVRELIVERLKR